MKKRVIHWWYLSTATPEFICIFSLYIIVMLLLSVLSGGAQAATTCSATPTYKTVSLSGKITIPRNVVPGTIIGNAYGEFTGVATGVTCNATPQLYISYASNQVLTSFSDVYQTNISGIGMKVWTTFGGTKYLGNKPVYWYTSNTNYASSWLAGVKIQFYATDTIDNIGEGVITLPSPLVVSKAGDSLTPYNYMSFASSVSIIKQKGCSVTDFDKNVVLPNVMKNELKSNVGPSTKSQAFNIKLACTQDTKVSVKFGGVGMSESNDVLANDSTGGGSAGSSVGVQMVYNDEPVPLNQNLDILDNALSNQELDFKARYYYNGGADIQAGGVTATTTFTFTYQ